MVSDGPGTVCASQCGTLSLFYALKVLHMHILYRGEHLEPLSLMFVSASRPARERVCLNELSRPTTFYYHIHVGMRKWQ